MQFKPSIFVILLLALSGLLPRATASNSPEFLHNIRQLNIEDGLSSRRINCIHQDRQGIMWIGTEDGINRYDGYEFKKWTKSSNGLSSRAIHYLLEDWQGLFWLISGQNSVHKDNISTIDIFNPKKGTHQTFEDYFGTDQPFDLSTITKFFSTEEGHLLFETTQGVWEYLPTSGFTKTSLSKPLKVITYRSPRMLFGSENDTLVKIDLSSNQHSTFSDVKNLMKLIGIDEQRYIAMSQVNPADFLFNKMIVIDAQKGISDLSQYPAQMGVRFRTFMDYDRERKKTWIVEGRRVAVFDDQLQLVYFFENAENTPREEIVERDFTTVFLDKNGIAWLGTDNGIYLFEIKENPFERLLYQDAKSIVKTIDAYRCRGLNEWEGYLYANTYKGVMKIDLATKDFQKIKRSNPEGYLLINPFPIAKSRNGQFWTGTDQLRLYDQVSDKEINIFDRPITSPDFGRIWAIYEDEEEIVWLGYESGLYQIAADAPEFSKPERYTSYNNFEEFGESYILQIFPEDKNELLLATDKGVFSLDKEKGVQVRYWHEGEGEFNLPSSRIQHIYKDKEGIYWLATDGAGLIRWDRTAGQWQQFGQAQGLSNNNIYAVYEDENDALWMSSDYGIIRLDKKTYTAKGFLPEDGITHYEFNRISHHQSADGRIYFGSLNGITTFDPNARAFLDKQEQHNEIVITAFSTRTWGKKKAEDRLTTLLEENALYLNHNQRDLNFNFSLQDYFYANRIEYFYQLGPTDSEWRPLQGNALQLLGLTPGEYTLSVKARTANGQFIKHHLSIPIVMAKPFLLQWWVLGILLCLLSFVVWRVYGWRLSRLKAYQQKLKLEVSKRTAKIEQQSEQLRSDKVTIEKQAKELIELDKNKSRFFANISHELRTPLSLILGPLNRVLLRNELKEEDRSYLQLMRQNGNQLLQRIDELLDLSRMEAKQLELKETPQLLYSLLKEQLASFRLLALQKQIRLSFDFQSSPDLALFIDGDKLKKIFNNLLSNALKFTPVEGEVKVVLIDQDNMLLLKIQDSGPGIHPDDLPHIFDRFYQAKYNTTAIGGTGIGLSLSRELALIIKAEITVESTYGKGSIFCVQFPKVEIIANTTSIGEDLAEKRAVAASEPIAQGNHQEKKGSILLVEDNHALREYLRIELRDYELSMAVNGKAAMELLERRQAEAVPLPGLIISDIMMPIMDGFELLRQLKASEKWQQLPVIMLTARSDQADKLTALRIGVDDYLIKPFDTNELLVRISNLLERTNQRQLTSTNAKEAKPQTLDKGMQEWLKKVETIVIDQLTNSHFTLEKLASDLFISKRQLQRRLKTATGLTAHNYLREIKLHQARQLLAEGTHETLSELSYAVGFTDPHYFSTLYQKRFGRKPKGDIGASVNERLER